MTPTVLAGVSAILWAATWLERLVAPHDSCPEPQALDAIAMSLSDIGAGPGDLQRGSATGAPQVREEGRHVRASRAASYLERGP